MGDPLGAAFPVFGTPNGVWASAIEEDGDGTYPARPLYGADATAGRHDRLLRASPRADGRPATAVDADNTRAAQRRKPSEIEIVWGLHASTFYMGVRKWVYNLPVSDNLDPIIEAEGRRIPGRGAASV
jgi:hypothetical protein